MLEKDIYEITYIQKFSHSIGYVGKPNEDQLDKLYSSQTSIEKLITLIQMN